MRTTTSPGQTRPGLAERTIGWLDQRLGVSELWNGLFARKIPVGVGYLYTLGFASLFVFSLQAVTGIFLATYYSPSPDHAYDSIQYIMYEAPFGAVVRGIHHWGASAMVVLVVLHMVTVFVLGAYKYPRELTWMVGVVLLLVTFGFGFTGYLLPWDEKAYWATEVGTSIPGTLPVVGDLILRIVRGGTHLGTLTLARFYALHTMLLPGSVTVILAIHLYLVVHHGVSVPPSLWDRPAARLRGLRGPREVEEPVDSPEEYHRRYDKFKEQGHSFWPYIVLEDTVVAAVVLVAIMALMVIMGVPTEARADPTNTAYVPRPEWYFMFLFQMLKYFPGSLEWFGAVVAPGLVLVLMLLLPLYDRSPWRLPSKRPVAMAAGLILIGITVLLTVLAYE